MAVEANKVAEAAVVSKAWKITIEDFRVILVLEFNNIRTKILYFGILKKKIVGGFEVSLCYFELCKKR